MNQARARIIDNEPKLLPIIVSIVVSISFWGSACFRSGVGKDTKIQEAAPESRRKTNQEKIPLYVREKVTQQQADEIGQSHVSYENITELDLSGMKLSDIEFIAAFPALRKLDLSENKIKSLEPLRGLSKLTHLDLSSALNSGEMMEQKYSSIPSSPAVEDDELLILTFVSLEPLVELEQLEYIDLSGNEYSIASIAPLAKLPALKGLKLQTGDVEARDNPLALSSELFDIWLSLDENCKISDLRWLDLRVIKDFPVLEELDLRGVKWVSPPIDLPSTTLLKLSISCGCSDFLDVADGMEVCDLSSLAGLPVNVLSVHFECTEAESIVLLSAAASVSKLILVNCKCNTIEVKGPGISTLSEIRFVDSFLMSYEWASGLSRLNRIVMENSVFGDRITFGSSPLQNKDVNTSKTQAVNGLRNLGVEVEWR